MLSVSALKYIMLLDIPHITNQGGHKMKKVKVKVSGMHCRSCEMLVKDVLEEHEGIIKAEASHAKGIVDVEYDEKKVDMKTIKSMIRGEGYEPE